MAKKRLTEEQRYAAQVIPKPNSGNFVIDAKAGTGKSTLLVILAKIMEESGIIICFNKSIQEEMTSKLSRIRNFEAKTVHSVGNSALRDNTYVRDVNRWKYYNIVSDNYLSRMHFKNRKEEHAVRRDIISLVSLAQLNLVDPEDEKELLELASHHGIPKPELAIKLLPNILDDGMKAFEQDGIIDFNDMIYYPYILDLPYPKFRNVFVDECQDLNILQQKVFEKLAIDPTTGRVAVGDENQAIYGFSGSDAKSYDNIRVSTNATVLPLTICFRCPVSHLLLAQEIVPDIKPRDNAPDGTLEWITNDDAIDMASPGSLTLSRTNAPLIRHCVDLMRQGKKARIRGKQFGKQLANILIKISKDSLFRFSELHSRVEMYFANLMDQMRLKGLRASTINMQKDIRDALLLVIDELDSYKSVDSIAAAIIEMFEDEDDPSIVWLSSVHRAKGLEADTVFILGYDKLPLGWGGILPWEEEQERNLVYVALTRSKDKLYLVEKEAEEEFGL